MTQAIMFVDCPELMNTEGSKLCGLPAEVRWLYTATSTDGPLESAMIRCPVGHWFNGPIELLSPPTRRNPVRASEAVSDDARGGQVEQETR